MNKLLILVLSSKTYPSTRNQKAQIKTWVKNTPPDVEIIFYTSGQKESINKNILTVNAGKKTSDIGDKTIKAFDWIIKNRDFDYIFRTNTSSYLNIENLLKYIRDLNNSREFVYGGKKMSLPKNNLRDKVEFVSGAGILLNRKTLDLILNNAKSFELEEWDDVAIGKLLQEKNITITPGYRFDVKGNIFKQKINSDFYHYRCRIDNHYGYPRFLEKFVILELHNRLNKIKLNKLKFIFYKFVFEICKFFYIQSPFWKLYEKIKTVLKLIIPNFFYIVIKNLLKNLDNKVKLRYLKK